jgi:hypothetical protein
MMEYEVEYVWDVKYLWGIVGDVEVCRISGCWDVDVKTREVS